MNTSITLLENNNWLETDSIIMTNYNEDQIFRNVVELFQNFINKKGNNCQIIEQKSTLQEKAKIIHFEESDEEKILWALYLKSRELMEDIEESNTQSQEQTITKDMAETYADTIYQKLTTYMINKNVKDQPKDDMTMPIYYIPGDSNNQVYPIPSSWYYIQDYKIYAQIGIADKTTNYIYCYEGSEELKKEGSCP